MSFCIRGMGWVTPLGRGVQPVWKRLLAGEEAVPEQINDTVRPDQYLAFRVANGALKGLAVHPRLRRASAISRFAAAAGLDALEEAKSQLGPIDLERIGLVLAVSNGGVVYTKRFYHDIAKAGAQSASPLLFPETVFNAPASHLASLLGLTGASYTLVSDGAVGILAIQMAEDLMVNRDLDFCLVVAAEEADWVLCDAYHKWKLLKSGPPIQLFSQPAKGTILSEGAGAILIGRNGPIAIDKVSAGANFQSRRDAEDAVARVVSDLGGGDVVFSSANGTFVDSAERAAVVERMPDTPLYSLKPALGESIGASALWQVIAAAQWLRTQDLPPLLNAVWQNGFDRSAPGGKKASGSKAIVLSCGLNQQAAGVRLTIA